MGNTNAGTAGAQSTNPTANGTGGNNTGNTGEEKSFMASFAEVSRLFASRMNSNTPTAQTTATSEVTTSDGNVLTDTTKTSDSSPEPIPGAANIVAPSTEKGSEVLGGGSKAVEIAAATAKTCADKITKTVDECATEVAGVAELCVGELATTAQTCIQGASSVAKTSIGNVSSSFRASLASGASEKEADLQAQASNAGDSVNKSKENREENTLTLPVKSASGAAVSNDVINNFNDDVSSQAEVNNSDDLTERLQTLSSTFDSSPDEISAAARAALAVNTQGLYTVVDDITTDDSPVKDNAEQELSGPNPQRSSEVSVSGDIAQRTDGVKESRRSSVKDFATRTLSNIGNFVKQLSRDDSSGRRRSSGTGSESVPAAEATDKPTVDKEANNAGKDAEYASETHETKPVVDNTQPKLDSRESNAQEGATDQNTSESVSDKARQLSERGAAAFYGMIREESIADPEVESEAPEVHQISASGLDDTQEITRNLDEIAEIAHHTEEIPGNSEVDEDGSMALVCTLPLRYTPEGAADSQDQCEGIPQGADADNLQMTLGCPESMDSAFHDQSPDDDLPTTEAMRRESASLPDPIQPEVLPSWSPRSSISKEARLCGTGAIMSGGVSVMTWQASCDLNDPIIDQLHTNNQDSPSTLSQNSKNMAAKQSNDASPLADSTDMTSSMTSQSRVLQLDQLAPPGGDGGLSDESPMSDCPTQQSDDEFLSNQVYNWELEAETKRYAS